MKNIIWAALLLLSTAASATTTRTVKLKIVETSDVHGHFFPYDFMEKKPLKGTLARVNTYIKRQRQQYGDRLLLLC